SLYDLFIPVHDRTPEDCVKLICENAANDAVQSTPEALERCQDFVIEAKAERLLKEDGHDVDVRCERGHVVLTMKKFVFWVSHYKGALMGLMTQIPDIKGDVEVLEGADFYADGRYSPGAFELPLKVLLVDDEREFVEALSRRLEARKLEPAHAYDGMEALAKLREEEQDVILLDLRMPGIDGMEVLRRIKKDHPDTEVIILTGHGSEKDEALARELGAFAYFQKPVDFDALARTMKEAQRKVRESREARATESRERTDTDRSSKG
ncbi:MAG: response regulator, partial [Candidatus Riflebacteria bacterium]|nr:response regulator [Candidatus Riflebacteria bacterium]